MWKVNVLNICMAEGEFGVGLPATISGTDLAADDSVKFTVKDRSSGATLLEKDYTGIRDNSFAIELTEAESALLPAGIYAYSLAWYHAGVFRCYIVPEAVFKVVGTV